MASLFNTSARPPITSQPGHIAICFFVLFRYHLLQAEQQRTYTIIVRLSCRFFSLLTWRKFPLAFTFVHTHHKSQPGKRGKALP